VPGPVVNLRQSPLVHRDSRIGRVPVARAPLAVDVADLLHDPPGALEPLQSRHDAHEASRVRAYTARQTASQAVRTRARLVASQPCWRTTGAQWFSFAA
jgi:hypothetical protein